MDFNYFPAGTSHTDDHRVVSITFENFDYGPGKIPEGSVVEVSQRQVAFVSPLVYQVFGRGFTLEGLRIQSGGRTYSWGWSIPTFYLILVLIFLTPLLLWSIAALIVAAMRREKARGVQP